MSLVVLCVGWSGFSDFYMDIIMYCIVVGINLKFFDIKYYRYIGFC